MDPRDQGTYVTACRALCSIDLDALVHNLAEVRRVVGPGVEVCAVVKADAYGHGAAPVARALVEAGTERLAVASFEEAVELRRAGIAAPIFVLGGIDPRHVAEAVELKLAAAVWDPGTATAIAGALRHGQKLAVHLKVDTGMHRLGSLEGDVADLVAAVRGLPLEIEGVMSHVACADEPGHPSVGAQIEAFSRLVTQLEALGVRPRLRHLANSAAALADPRTHHDMVRIGLLLYGCAPHPVLAGNLQLRPVMRLRTSIVQLKRVPPGSGVGYGFTHVTKRPTTLAVLPVGYAFGYPRALSNRAEVLVRGHRAPVIGTISMDHVTIDVTDVPGPRVGDVVTLWGPESDDPGAPGAAIDVMELGARAGTIGYELLTGVSQRTPRTWLSRGKGRVRRIESA